MFKRVKLHHEFMLDYFLEILRSLSRPAVVFLTFFSFTVMFLAAALFYLFEIGVNPDLSGYFDAFYYTVATMTTVGYGDIVATTTGGKIISIGMMLGGTVIYVSFTAVLASSLMEIEQSKNS